MLLVNLLTKVYSDSLFVAIDEFLQFALKGLKVETKISGFTTRGWVQISVSGEDEKVALHYLAEEIGLCITRLEDVKKFAIVKGYVTSISKSKDKIYVDIGIHSPKNVDVAVPLQCLQAQLLDGKKAPLREIVGLFGFCENLPLSIKIFKIDKENYSIEALLSESQLGRYRHWKKSLLQRLIVLGASLEEIKLALKTAKCNRDIVEIEPLGLFEYAVTCKLGTDATGLIPKIGKNLRNATLAVFNPEKW